MSDLLKTRERLNQLLTKVHYQSDIPEIQPQQSYIRTKLSQIQQPKQPQIDYKVPMSSIMQSLMEQHFDLQEPSLDDTPQPEPSVQSSIIFDDRIPVEDKLINIKRFYTESNEQKRILKEKQEQDSLRGPFISQRSQKLAQKRYGNTDVVDRLLSAGNAKRQLEKESQELSQLENRLRSNPNISSMAVQLNREGDVVERLNNYKKEYDSKRLQKIQEMEQQCCNNPDCLHRRKEKGQKVNVQESSNRLHQYKPKQKVEEEKLTFQPQLSNRSRKLASKLPSALERLTNQSQMHSTYDDGCTFKPQIDQFSNQLSQKQGGDQQRWEKLYNQGKITREKLQNKRKEILNQQVNDPQYTFKPQLQAKYNRKQSGNLIERMDQWKKQKEDRIIRKQEAGKDKGLESCTFAPRINKNYKKQSIDETHQVNIKIPNQTFQSLSRQISPTYKTQKASVPIVYDDDEDDLVPMELPVMEQQPDYPNEQEEDFYEEMKALRRKLHSIDFA